MVGADGHPSNVTLEKGSGAAVLDDAALEAVKHWSFVPARRAGHTVAATVDVPVRFRLN
jgi:protein TonB